MMYWGNHMGTGSWIFSILGTLIIIGLIIALIVWAVSPRSEGGSSAGETSEPAGEILDRRLASGEITTEQYEQLTHTLGYGRSSSRGVQPAHPAGTRV